MKNLFKPASLLLYFLVILLFFLGGMAIAGVTDAAKGQGLAGGAIVFMYGVIMAIIAFIISLFVTYNANFKTIIRINKILGILLLLAICLVVFRVLSINKNKAPAEELPTKTTTANAKEMAIVNYKDAKKPNLRTQIAESSMGIGFFLPNYIEYPTLYFYGGVNLEKGLMEHIPMDSVVFSRDKYQNPTTSYVPPWLFPKHLKLDYGVIIFKALGIGRDFVKVEANKQTHKVSYLDKNKGRFIPWSSFLLTINSVEFIDSNIHAVRVKPLDYAGEVTVPFEIMTPILVEEDWMYVTLFNGSLKEQGKGWIRWKKDGKLLISYSLFS